MNSWTEKTWTMAIFNQAIAKLMQTYDKIPPRPLQSEVYIGPMGIEKFRMLQQAKQLFNEKDLKLPALSVDPKQ
jgi:arylsulfatase